MSWVTWRQHRQEAVIGLGLLLLIGGYLVLTGLSMYHTAEQWQLFSCRFDGGNVTSSCTLGMSDFESTFLNLSIITGGAITILPAIVGVFVGAPLIAREIEHHTHVLAWTQSITRFEWFRTKVCYVCVATVIASSLLAGISTWWYRPMDLAFIPEGPWHFFSVTGFVPIAYAVFSLGLGLAVGVVLRRTVAAMAATLVLFIGFRAAIQLIRPWFLSPSTKELDFVNPAFPHDALLVSVGWVDASGRAVSYNDVSVMLQQGFPGVVIGNGPSPLTETEAAAINDYLHAHGLHYLVSFQPADRFWTFQGIEAGIFLAATLVLIAFTIWWLVRRVHAR